MNILKSLLFSARGEVGDESAPEITDEAPEMSEGTGETEVAAPSESLETGTEIQADQTQGEEQTFLTGDENLDPRKLDPALQPIFKRMQGVYTQRMQNIAEIRERAAEVDRFYNDPTFAQQSVLQWATNNGYTITPPGGQPTGQQGQQQDAQAGQVPAYLVEAFKKNLAPELQWLAEPQASAMWTAMQGMLDPVLKAQEAREKEQQTQAQKAKQTEWTKHAEKLGEVAPGWEEHEDAMGDLFDFMKSDQLNHPQFGSKLQMLYDLATARAASLKQAQQRVANAGKNRVTSSRPTSRSANVEEDILKANPQDAWKLAKQAALAQHRSKTA